MSNQDEILQRLMKHEEPARGGVAALWRLVLLVAVGVWMVYLSRHPAGALSVWDAQDPQRVLPWLGQVSLRYTLHAVAFLVLGMLLPGLLLGNCCRGRENRPERPSAETAKPRTQASAESPRRRSKLLGLLRNGVIAILAVSLALGIAAWLIGALTFSWGLQMALDSAVTAGALVLGCWIAFAWRRSRWGFAGQLVIAGLWLVLVGWWLYGQVIQREPLGFETPAVTIKDKRDLLELVKRDSVQQDGQRIYRIDQEDLNKLLAWWMTVGAVEGKARVDFDPKSQRHQLTASLPLPADSDPARFINVRVCGQFFIDYEELDLSLDSIQIGSVALPRGVSRWLSRYVVRWISSDRDNMDMLAGIVSASVEGTQVEVVVSDDGVRTRRIAKVLRQIGRHPDVSPQVTRHLTAFAEIARTADRQDPLFEEIVRDAFRRARDSHNTPTDANRAAILALGIALGHVNLERVVGDCWAGDSRVYVYRIPRQSSLQDRSDWARHFWVSAALTLLVDNQFSDAAGVFKEELDSLDGGSGFSFGDLMADRAGTEFARTAISDAATARAIQRWVLDPGTDLNQLMPPAGDLPEGLSEAEFAEQFGGVDGANYKELVAKMEERLREVAWRQ